MDHAVYRTTYRYASLPTGNYIRLLRIVDISNADNTKQYSYDIVQAEINSEYGSLPEFEAISYTWGDAKRVSSLALREGSGRIGLTENLTVALPHLSRHSTTKYLWIDQICIDQNDASDKSHQIGLMSRIYKAATRVLVWLGPEDESSRLCVQWLRAVEEMIKGMPNSDRMTPGSATYNSDVRLLVVRSTFVSKDTDPIYAPAIRRFWARQWFTRGWIVQELLLATSTLCIIGDCQFGLQDLADLQSIPADKALEVTDQEYISYNTLMNLKLYPFTEHQPLRFLRLMAQTAQEFETTEPADRLYAFLGMIEGSGFIPDYSRSIRQNFTNFAAAMAQTYGSLDFLSLWSANLDELLPATPEEFKGFPSWVPSWSATPLSAPFRFAAGGVRTFRNPVTWLAANGRPHIHEQPEDAGATGRLHVRGKIIDHIDSISSARFARYWDVDKEHLDSLVNTIKQDLPGTEFDTWTHIDLVHFLNVISGNGNEPRESAEEVLGIIPKVWGNELTNMSGYNESLGASLTIGRGRRVITTRGGRIGLAPFIGSKQGSVIVILHGCIVPMVLERVSESGDEYKVIGDCYVKGIMHGEAVTWNVEEGDRFVLV